MRPSEVSAGVIFESAGSQWSRSWWRWIAYALTPFGWAMQATPEFIRKRTGHFVKEALTRISSPPTSRPFAGLSMRPASRTELHATEGDLEGWQDVLGNAIQLAGNRHIAYLKGRPSVRRRFNDAVLEPVYIRDRKIGRLEFSEVFAPLFARPSSNKALKVDPRGFEPLTFWLPARRSTS
jgi:hypothetical protein